MIRQVSDITGLCDDDSYYSGKIRAHFRAYGGCYDFMRFFDIGGGVAAFFNSSLTISGVAECDPEELKNFITMYSPHDIELPPEMAEGVIPDGYIAEERTLFRFVTGEYDASEELDESPRLDDVFGIVSDSFGIEDGYDLWLTDMSHRIRHGVSKVFLSGKTTATMHFVENGRAFFGQIATSPEDRGKGKARRLLYRLGERYETAELFAKEERAGFYKEIGFIAVGKDRLYTRKN